MNIDYSWTNYVINVFTIAGCLITYLMVCEIIGKMFGTNLNIVPNVFKVFVIFMSTFKYIFITAIIVDTDVFFIKISCNSSNILLCCFYATFGKFIIDSVYYSTKCFTNKNVEDICYILHYLFETISLMWLFNELYNVHCIYNIIDMPIVLISRWLFWSKIIYICYNKISYILEYYKNNSNQKDEELEEKIKHKKYKKIIKMKKMRAKKQNKNN